MIAEAKKTLAVFDVAISPTARMGSLPVGLRQIVEIVKAARTGAQVVMLDEPTSAISEREVEGLYAIVQRLRDHGVAMVYTTHKMAEICAIADRVVVLRDGGLILDSPLDQVSDDDIVTSMIGRELDALFPHHGEPKPDTVRRDRSDPLRAAGNHQGDDQRHFDDGDGDGEHERPERFADPVIDHLRMMDGGEDRGGQQDAQQRQHDRREHRDHTGPPQLSDLVSRGHSGHYSVPVRSEDADRRSDPCTRTSRPAIGVPRGAGQPADGSTVLHHISRA